MKVRDPHGETWRVRRRLLPWRRRVRRLSGPNIDTPALGDDPISAIIGTFLLILFIPALIVALVIAVEFLVLVLLLPVALLIRVLFGHHWTVEVRRGWTLWWHQPSGDWSESGRRIASIAELLSRGQPPPRTAAR